VAEIFNRLCPCLVDLQAAVQCMEFTEAVARSMQSGTSLALPLLDI